VKISSWTRKETAARHPCHAARKKQRGQLTPLD